MRIYCFSNKKDGKLLLLGTKKKKIITSWYDILYTHKLFYEINIIYFSYYST